MSNYIFFYREKNNITDRDACAYLKYKTPAERFECGHYFGCIAIHGACYVNHTILPYEEVETILTKKEYNELLAVQQKIEELKYGITIGDERYKKGIAIYESIEHIFDKLRSEKGIAFKNKIMESEHEMMKEKYNLSDEDIEQILDEYGLDYEDKGIVSCVYEDAYELGECRADDFYDIDEHLKDYIDFEKYGEDIAEDSSYVELSDGRIVYLNY